MQKGKLKLYIIYYKIFLRALHILTLLLYKCYLNKATYIRKVCYRTLFQDMNIKCRSLSSSLTSSCVRYVINTGCAKPGLCPSVP